MEYPCDEGVARNRGVVVEQLIGVCYRRALGSCSSCSPGGREVMVILSVRVHSENGRGDFDDSLIVFVVVWKFFFE